MVGGKPWTDEENKLLLSMIAQGLSFQEVFESGLFLDRTFEAIRLEGQRHCAPSPLKTKRSPVQEITPSENALSLEQVVKFFSSAFEQMCASKEVDKCMLERFRIIFQAARDYGPLLAHFERWEKIEKQIDELGSAVVELQATKGIKRAS
jgi:hypothetical protein